VSQAAAPCPLALGTDCGDSQPDPLAPAVTLEILKTLEKSHVGGWFPWGFLPSPDCLILWSVPDACKDVDLDVLVEALKPVGTFKKIGKVFRREEDSTVGLLQIGDDVDYLLIPREIHLAGAVWRVLSKPATKEAEFRERLTQFLEEEGRTLEDVARMIEKSTPHPPQPPKKPKAPRERRRVPLMVTPPPRLVVGTYDSSNASDSEFSDFEMAKARPAGRGARRGRRVRRMPVSYLGSKFLGSDVESEDDEELVDAFLRRGEKPPSAQPARRRLPGPVPVVEDNPGPRPSRADRCREYISQVSWGRLKQRVKGWAPRTRPNDVEPEPRDSRGQGQAEREDGEDPTPRRWRPRISWASFRGRRREGAVSTAHRTGVLADQGAEAVADQGVEDRADQGVEGIADQRGEGMADQRAEEMAGQGVEAVADQGVEAVADQGVEAVADQGVEAVANQRAGAMADQGAEGMADHVVEGIAGQASMATKNQRAEGITGQRTGTPADQGTEAEGHGTAETSAGSGAEAAGSQRVEAAEGQRAEAAGSQRVEAAEGQRVEAAEGQRVEAAEGQRAEAAGSQRVEAAEGQRVEAAEGQRVEAAGSQRAGPSANLEADTSAARGPPGAVPGARAQKPVKTVRFQTPGRFSWFRKRHRAFWHSPRLPVLPKRAPRAGDTRSLRVLRAEARVEEEQREREDQL
ncbi:coiled-coil domain-containing protein 8, partial [Ochotona princeps]|uniref:coiled-coil domain-containing protein 8 n=1 Tax=Ochotona princeps TaxID=9978 RepID=UPI00271465EC